MKTVTIKVKTLTPIWTGDASGHSTGKLQMSGIIGGMRQAFEMLVRKHGGTTCDCTGENRCPQEITENGVKKKVICPACAVFGCTGLARSFRLRIEGLKGPISMDLPMTDGADGRPNIPNRKHEINPGTGEPFEYPHPCAIEKWLAVGAGADMGIEPEKVDEWLRKNNVKVIPQGELTLRFDVLRAVPSANDTKLNFDTMLKYFMVFMARYRGLGAKVQQGWGIFSLAETISKEEIDLGIKGIQQLKDAHNQVKLTYGKTLQNAADCFSVEWKIPYFENGFDFIWKEVKTHTPPWQVGYGMRYRLRRHVKFDDFSASSPKLPWDKTLYFVHLAFGYDEKAKGAPQTGCVGVSHILAPHSDDSRIRLFGCINDHASTHLSFLSENEMENLGKKIGGITTPGSPSMSILYLVKKMEELISAKYPKTAITYSNDNFYYGGRI